MHDTALAEAVGRGGRARPVKRCVRYVLCVVSCTLCPARGVRCTSTFNVSSQLTSLSLLPLTADYDGKRLLHTN
jgi:hypothetical protein